MAYDTLRCPKCGEIDMVQKVSAVYTGGITSGVFAGSSTGVAIAASGNADLMRGATNLKGTSQTNLSRRLAPPSQPSGQNRSGPAIVVFVLFLCFALALLCYGSVNLVSSNLLNIISGMLLVVLAISTAIGGLWVFKKMLFLSPADRAHQLAQTNAWHHAVEKWNCLYYCSRDDGVFEPGEKEFVPVEHMIEYLYR